MDDALDHKRALTDRMEDQVAAVDRDADACTIFLAQPISLRLAGDYIATGTSSATKDSARGGLSAAMNKAISSRSTSA